MNFHTCLFTKNDCYRAGRTIKPEGVMVHSTGANNPNLRRYVQPDDGLLGKNKNGNHWNRPGVDKCVHAFIGKLADGTVATYQVLPWEWRGWHAAGWANDTHISFEICEDGLDDRDYFERVYREAVELTAMLCSEYNLDPLADGAVICHKEGYRRGIASNHGDVEHWFPRFGKTMDDFRKDVARELEEEEVTQEQFNEMMAIYLKQLAEQPDTKWGAEWSEAKEWAESNGLIKGDENGNKQYQSFTTRQAMVLFLYRLTNMLKESD